MFRISLRELGSFDLVALVGHCLALVATFSLLIEPSVSQAIIVTLALGLGYLALVWRSKEGVHLYPASLFISASYLLTIGLFSPFEALLLWLLLYLLCLYALAHLFRRWLGNEFSMPLTLAGRLSVALLVALLAYWQPFIRDYFWVIVPLLIYAFIDLGLTWLYGQRWYLLPTALFLSWAYYFSLPLVPGMPPQRMVAYYALAAPLCTLAGWAVQKVRGQEWAQPLYLASLLIALISSVSLFWGESSAAGLSVLLTAAVTCTLLLIITRGEEYIYLLTLSLGLTGYHLLRLEGSRFSPRLVDDFLIGLILVGILFLYPVAKKALRYQKSLTPWVAGHWQRSLLIGLPLLSLIPLMAISYTFEFTENPSFCGSCHNMKTQFEAWQRSSHKEYACLECHYPPGVPAFVEGKVVGLTEVVNFVAGTFETKPHALVASENCLRCHPLEELKDELRYRGTIKYNHAELEPGRSLDITMRCNVCHAHILDGFHFQVRDTVCYDCHFIGRAAKPTAVGDCFTCHDTPDDWRHADVIEATDETSCTTAKCHLNVTKGEGRVRSERCLSCHGQISPTWSEAKEMHEAHIPLETSFRRRKVECFECHEEIIHGEEVFPELPWWRYW
ncbi:MAG: NapC/NirT family cytochrome c [Anaerolineae bacterium]